MNTRHGGYRATFLRVARSGTRCRPVLCCRPACYSGTVLTLLLALLLASALTAAADELPDDLTNMSLEALMNLEVTSVSKKPERQTGAAAAIFVITNNDLRRWGVTNIPEALRRVPGISVARIDANKWAITSRGFNSRFANKLLVLIDGRSVYTPPVCGCLLGGTGGHAGRR